MKHIKSYRLFESKSSDLLELLDLGLISTEDLPGLIRELDDQDRIALVKPLIEKYGYSEIWTMFSASTMQKAYADDPRSYLDQFDNISRTDGETTSRKAETMFRDKDGEMLFYYYPSEGEIVVSYKKIWMFFEKTLKFNDIQIRSLLANWFQNRFGLYLVDPREISVFY